MRKLLVILSSVFALGMGGVEAQSADPASLRVLLKKTSDQYRALRTYEIEAKTMYVIAQGGRSGTLEQKAQLAVGNNGAFRIEQEINGVPELRMSDGTTTWKVLPKQKLWAKSELAQAVQDEEDDPDLSSASMVPDLFTQTQIAFVKRYTGLERYLESIQVERDTRLKLNGEKVDCVVLHLPGKESDNRLFISKDNGWVVRHIEVLKQKDGTYVKMTTDYNEVKPGMPSQELFVFEASKAGRQVNDVPLPSERNVSLVGQRAADFTLTSLSGLPVHLAELEGKVVLLDFWASWCLPCRHELPTIEALSRRYKDKNIVVFGINNEDQKIAGKFLEQHHPDLATLHDEKGKIQKMYGCHAIPTVMVIDPAGKIVAHFVGERSEKELVAALKQAGMR